MNTRLLAIFIGACSLLLLYSTGVLSALVWFVLIGAVPGTTYSLPPWLMLSALCLGGGALMIRIMRAPRPTSDTAPIEPLPPATRTPRRRYQRTRTA